MQDESKLPAVLRKKLPPNLEKIKYGTFSSKDRDYPLHLYLREQDITIQEQGSDIVEFLKGKDILITGATGFLGKLLVEKLLRSCKDLGTIYILVRSKKGKDPQTRVKEYLDNLIFYKLAEIFPNYKDKVFGITGDFEEDGLGLSDESRKLLKSKVNIIYHIAATVRFDEKLQKAVKVNLVGTHEMLQLAKGCEKLEAFVHMSTAFSNCHHRHIEEAFYPAHVDPYKLMDITTGLPEEVVDRITPGLLDAVPNTYAFTKQIAEDLVRREAVGFPCCIQRPSIVTGTFREPIRSWVDNVFGPVGLMVGAGTGILHIVYGKPDSRCDFVPADYVINHCIACSYKTAKDGCKDRIQIFNYTTSDENATRWKYLEHARPHATYGSTKTIFKGFGRFTGNYYWYLLVRFWLHTVPGYIYDLGMSLSGRKESLTKMYKKIHKFIFILSYFTLNEYSFGYRNTTNLWDEIGDVDKKNFPFDMSSLNWNEYFTTYLAGPREFLLNDILDNFEESRKLFLKLDIIFYVLVTTVIALSTYFLINTIFFFIPLTFLSILGYYMVTANRVNLE